MIVDQLTHQTVLTLLETAFTEERDAGTFAGAPDQLARHELMRAALAGRTVTPSIFDMMLVIGRDESIGRIQDAAGQAEA